MTIACKETENDGLPAARPHGFAAPDLPAPATLPDHARKPLTTTARKPEYREATREGSDERAIKAVPDLSRPTIPFAEPKYGIGRELFELLAIWPLVTLRDHDERYRPQDHKSPTGPLMP
jgi:hypothetical protein